MMDLPDWCANMGVLWAASQSRATAWRSLAQSLYRDGMRPILRIETCSMCSGLCFGISLAMMACTAVGVMPTFST
jgi:hypothetical protein